MTLLNGDCLEVLKNIPDNSIDSIVTDPPYGLSFMGKKWDYDVPTKELWQECLRVLKPGGHLLSFGGTRTYHRLAVAIEDAGFEIRDQIQWIYGSGFPKSHNIKEGDFKGWGTALKPANEPICLARKPLEKGLTVAANVLKWGTGAINIDETRVGTEVLPAQKAGQATIGTFERHNMVTPERTGRWPANVILDEEAAAVLDEQSGVSKSTGGGALGFFNNTDKNTSMGNGKAEFYTPKKNMGKGDSGGASRFFYVAKASKRERNAGLEGEVKEKQGARPNSKDASGKFPDHDYRPSGGNNHPTVKPVKLMEYLIKLVTPQGGTVLDPFMGSGTTGVAAKNLSFKFIGIEMNEEYFKIAEKRIG